MPQQPFAGGARRLAGAAGSVGGAELHGEAEDHLVTVVQHAVGRHALLGADGEHQPLAARLHLAHLPGATPTGYRGATQAQDYHHGQNRHRIIIMGQHRSVIVGQHRHRIIIMGQNRHRIIIMGQHRPVIVGQHKHRIIIMGQHRPVIMGQNRHRIIIMGQHRPVIVGQHRHRIIIMGQHRPVIMGQNRHRIIIMGQHRLSWGNTGTGL